MEPYTTNWLMEKIGSFVGRVSCRLGGHSYSWKLEQGERITSEIPDRAVCQYCGKTKAHLKGK